MQKIISRPGPGVEQDHGRFHGVIIQCGGLHRSKKAVHKACRGACIDSIDKIARNDRKGKHRNKYRCIGTYDPAGPFGNRQQRHAGQTGHDRQNQAKQHAQSAEQNRQQEKQAATLGSKIEKTQNQRVDVRSIEKIVATSIPFSSKVAVEREDFDRISTLAKKYVTAEKKESKLQKAVDAANKLIAKLKAEIDSLKQEISDYKSVHSKLRAAELERENTELRGKVRSYEDVIQRNNLWRFFHPLREKAVTRDEAR